MRTFGRHLRRGVVLTTICLLLLSNSGCTLTGGFVSVLWTYMRFFKTLPAVPVPAYQSQLIEDKLWEDERYNRVPVLDPVEGDVFCVDPPSEDQIMRAMPSDPAGGFAFFRRLRSTTCELLWSLWWTVWTTARCIRWSGRLVCITVTTSARFIMTRRFGLTGRCRSLTRISLRKWFTSTRTI